MVQQKMAEVSFTIKIRTKSLPRLETVISSTMSSSPAYIKKSVDSRGSYTRVFIEATGPDQLQLEAFKEWAQDFACGLAR